MGWLTVRRVAAARLVGLLVPGAVGAAGVAGNLWAWRSDARVGWPDQGRFSDPQTATGTVPAHRSEPEVGDR